MPSLRPATDPATDPTSELVAQVERRLLSIRGRTPPSPPWREAGVWLVRRRSAGCVLPQVWWCAADDDGWTPPEPDDSRWRLLLDGDRLAAATGYADVGAVHASPDGRLAACTLDTAGAEAFDLVVLDLRTAPAGPGEPAPEVDRLRAVSPRFAWTPDAGSVLYATVDATLRPDTVHRHRVGADRADDEVVLHEPDPSCWVGVGTTTSGRPAVLVGSQAGTEWWLLDGVPDDAPDRSLMLRRVLSRDDGAHYQLDHVRVGAADHLLVLRERPGEPGTLGLAPWRAEGWADVRPVLRGGPGLQLVHVSASASAICLDVRDDGVPATWLYRVDGIGSDGVLPAPAVRLAGAWAAPAHDWRQPFVRATRWSWTRPAEVLDVDVATGATTVRRVAATPPGYDPDAYESERVLVPSSADGTLVPVTVLGRRGAPRPAPLVLDVYGAYGHCTDPGLDPARVELLDRGVRVAIAHVRGGGELGPDWHAAAQGVAKERTFTDFLDCARHLVHAGWTTPDGLVARGASAGGLVVAVAAAREPLLFAGIAALVPFVDPLSALLDPAAPLTTLERTEWGDPLADPQTYAALAAYSPRQNSAPVPYPPMYVTVAPGDWRVDPEHVTDWVRQVRTTARGSVLLRRLPSGGHAGPSDPRQQAREEALLTAWLLEVTAG